MRIERTIVTTKIIPDKGASVLETAEQISAAISKGEISEGIIMLKLPEPEEVPMEDGTTAEAESYIALNGKTTNEIRDSISTQYLETHF